MSGKVTERVFTPLTPSKKYFAHYLGVSNIVEEAATNKFKNQSHIGLILGNDRPVDKSPKNINKLLEHTTANRPNNTKRSLTPITSNKKIFNETKTTQGANEGDSGRRWEGEANRIMKVVREHQVREVAELQAQRNGLVKRSLTPKITERNVGEEEADCRGESCEESVFAGVGQSKGAAVAKAELAKEYEQVIKQTREKRAYEMDIERRNDQERLESVMRDHQRKLAIIVEMKKVSLACNRTRRMRQSWRGC